MEWWLDLNVNIQKQLPNIKGYIILLVSFIMLMVIKELEVRTIKKIINDMDQEILKVQ